MRVIITRPAAQGAAWVQQLRTLGVDAVSLPLIGIESTADPARVRAAWAQLPEMALVMFVSANAVDHFFRLRPPGATWPASAKAGSTGPGTSAALQALGLPPSQIVAPDADGPFDTEALWRKVLDWPWAGTRALVVRGEEGRDWLADQLRQSGCSVDFVAAYRRVPPQLAGAAAELVQASLAQPTAHGWHFSSSEAIEHLARACPQADWSRSLSLCTHPRIGDTARRAGFGSVLLIGSGTEAVGDWVRGHDRARAQWPDAGGPGVDPRR